MTPKEHLIQRLRALCASSGGPDAVAEKAEVSADNLKQILAGTKLPNTGQPRGVGPTVQRKLDAAYPGWSGLSASPPPAPPSDYRDRRLVSDSDWALLNDIKTAMESPSLAEQVRKLREEAAAMEAFAAKFYKPK